MSASPMFPMFPLNVLCLNIAFMQPMFFSQHNSTKFTFFSQPLYFVSAILVPKHFFFYLKIDKSFNFSLCWYSGNMGVSTSGEKNEYLKDRLKTPVNSVWENNVGTSFLLFCLLFFNTVYSNIHYSDLCGLFFVPLFSLWNFGAKSVTKTRVGRGVTLETSDNTMHYTGNTKAAGPN